MSDRKCIRCGDEEFRINGYCSCECESLHERELIIKKFHEICLKFDRKYHVRDERDEEIVEDLRKLMGDSKWAADCAQ